MRFKPAFRTPAIVLASLLLVGCLILAGARLLSIAYAAPRTFTATAVQPARVAIVFGAGLARDGSPTPVLRDRVRTAVDLYFAGKVQKILMSGDNRFANYNEPAAMRSLALRLGVPDADIVLDFAGRRTYDTCFRARAIFGVADAILVTQAFHLPRALLLCNALGVQSTGVTADLHSYGRIITLWWELRELPAAADSYLEAYVTHPLPILGKPEPIFPPIAANKAEPYSISAFRFLLPSLRGMR